MEEDIGEKEHYFECGVIAKINNNYKGQYGTIGIVYQISPTFVYISDVEGESYHRAPKNLKVVAENVNEYTDYQGNIFTFATHMGNKSLTATHNSGMMSRNQL